MAKTSKRKIRVSPAKPVTAKPVSTPLAAAATAQIAAGRSNVAKAPLPMPAPTANGKAPKAAKTPKPVTVRETVAPLDRQAARDQRYFDKASYPGNSVSDNDTAYLELFSRFVKATKSGIGSIPAITLSGMRPSGISILNNRARLRRLTVLGLCSYCDIQGKPVADQVPYFRVTDAGKKLAAYTSAKPIAAS